MKQDSSSFMATSAVLSTILFSACFPNGPEDIEELDMVVTKHDVSFDFQSLKTYALPSKIVKITGKAVGVGDIEFIDEAYAVVILADIDENMERYGWTKVAKEQDPDVILLPSAASVTEELWYYDYYYWAWYYPNYYWDWYYPYPIYGGSYTTGSLIMQMTYPDGITASDNIPVIWSGLFNGILDGDPTNLGTRVDNGIARAFEQSPYLNLTPR